MPKSTPSSVYVCQSCGAQTKKWMGFCQTCNAQEPLEEEPVRPVSASADDTRYRTSPLLLDAKRTLIKPDDYHTHKHKTTTTTEGEGGLIA